MMGARGLLKMSRMLWLATMLCSSSSCPDRSSGQCCTMTAGACIVFKIWLLSKVAWERTIFALSEKTAPPPPARLCPAPASARFSTKTRLVPSSRVSFCPKFMTEIAPPPESPPPLLLPLLAPAPPMLVLARKIASFSVRIPASNWMAPPKESPPLAVELPPSA